MYFLCLKTRNLTDFYIKPRSYIFTEHMKPYFPLFFCLYTSAVVKSWVSEAVKLFFGRIHQKLFVCRCKIDEMWNDWIQVSGCRFFCFEVWIKSFLFLVSLVFLFLRLPPPSPSCRAGSPQPTALRANCFFFGFFLQAELFKRSIFSEKVLFTFVWLSGRCLSSPLSPSALLFVPEILLFFHTYSESMRLFAFFFFYFL